MFMKRSMLCFFIVLFAIQVGLYAQQVNVYPTSWWTGMKHNKIQLMIHGDKDLSKILSINYPGVKLLKVYQPENKHYLFADLEISPATKPGSFAVKMGDGKSFMYKLQPKSKNSGITRVRGVHANDLVYLIMPDRFANGDPANDEVPDYEDKQSDRSNPFARHGGDIKGVEDKLDYLKDLGVTTIWMTPLFENNMPRMNEGKNSMSGYHGYWITNHYTVDKRMGGNEAYMNLTDAAHRKGMKIIQDAVYNHIGSYHHTVLDMPFKEWLNQWPAYQGSNHRDEVFFDPYAAKVDKDIMVGGWFTPHLPDLNLANPYVSNYVIQNTIWATEMFGIDGWRVDTYKYCDEAFLNRINTALENEFPGLTVFGEAWTNTITGGAYFAQNNMIPAFKHNLQGITDFPFNGAILDAVNQKADFTAGVNRLYMTLAQDVLYKDPMRNCIFLDNHDMNRSLSMVGEDMNKYKMALGLLLTQRGIPQLYYGAEIAMKNFKNPTDAEVRKDFPGGWAGDSVNKFTPSGRTAQEQEAFNYVKKLALFRQTSSAIGRGKLMQYIPQDGAYVYFRYDGKQTIMCVLNSGEKPVTLKLSRFDERLKGASQYTDVISGKSAQIGETLDAPAGSFLVLEVK
jgi:glycosidase